MKISLHWLRDYLPDLPDDAPAVADALTHGGLPVELIERAGDDTVIDVEVTSNRGDCLSHLGVARELAALMGLELRDVEILAAEAARPAKDVAQVRIDALDLCPHYTARVLQNVKVGPSPAWMVQRLEAVGVRAINNVVDVTNYVMFEMGQPLHAFDFDTLRGGQIIVRTARAGEKIVSIDGHERLLNNEMLVIADAKRPVALAGVMGGRDTEVSANSVNLLLESARFDPLCVRKTARALAMKSDSSYRFERGIDPALPLRASLRAAQLILQTAGGELLGGAVVAGAEHAAPKSLSLRLSRLKQLLGVELPVAGVIDALNRLGLSPAHRGETIDVTVPTRRLDLNIEADLIEEVARVIGYDKIPVRDEIAIRLTPPEPAARSMETIRSTLVAGGYFEAVTFSFVSDALADDFAPRRDDGKSVELLRADERVRKADARLRPSILPGLLEAVRRNETAGTSDAKLFEIGSTFWRNNVSNGADERRRLGLVGSRDLREVRGVVEAMLNRLDANRAVRVVPESRDGFARGAGGRIEWGQESIGYLGVIDRSVAEKLSLRHAPAAAELEISALLHGAQHVPQLRPLPRFPAVRRDLSLDINESTRYEQLESLVHELKLDQLEDIEYVTTYRGKPLEKGKKSVTITLVFRSASGTLTSEAVEAQVQQVVSSAQTRLSAALRT